MDAFDATFLPWFSTGCAAGAILSTAAAFRRSRWAAVPLVAVGILAAWGGLVVGVHEGYGAWQSIDNPPEEAFADGAQLTGSVLFGWLPSAAGCLLVFTLARRLRSRPGAAATPPPLKDHLRAGRA